MKKIACIALLVGMSAGCGLLDKPKENDDQNQGGGDQGNGAQGGTDATQYVQAPGRVMIGPDAKVGWMAERTTQASGQTLVESYAIVGEAGDSWKVESKSPTIDALAGSFPDLKGSLLGLVVRKADGVVTKAVIGKPGEAGKEIKISPAGDAPATTAPTGTPDRVTIKLGTFDAMKNETSGITTWVGTSGETKGILLKSAGMNQDYELAEMPKTETKDVGGVSVTTTGTSYTNGMKLWMTENEIIAGVFGAAAGEGGKRSALYRMESGGTTQEVTAVKTDAAPQLKWE